MNTPLLTNEYLGQSGVTYKFEYYETDSFDHLPNHEITQCYGIAFVGDKFLVVNNVAKPGSYTPVGGTVEEGEHPDETLIREIKEESNMKVLEYKPIGYQRVVDMSGIQKPYYQLRYMCKVEPYGPFVSDPAEKVTELIEVSPTEYKKYFDWGEIGDRIIIRALELKA